MQTKKTILLAQLFISCLMALLMSGIMGAIHMGLTAQWLHAWPLAWLTAWPIAFVLSLGVGPLSFWLASRVVRKPV